MLVSPHQVRDPRMVIHTLQSFVQTVGAQAFLNRWYPKATAINVYWDDDDVKAYEIYGDDTLAIPEDLASDAEDEEALSDARSDDFNDMVPLYDADVTVYRKDIPTCTPIEVTDDPHSVP